MNLKITIPTSVVLSVALGVSAEARERDDRETPFEEAFVFFELNHTDGDLGIHAKIDGGPWQWVHISDPGERRLMVLRNAGRLRAQGLTELFFESAEPTFDELAPRDFFRRFPAGTYEVEGRGLEWEALESEVEVSHAIPAPAVVRVNQAPMALECDEDAEDYDITEVAPPVAISWEPVTMSHPDAEGAGAAVQPPIEVDIVNYEVVVEAELEIEGEEFTSVFSVIVPPDSTEMTVPAEVLALADTFKYEVLARAASYNQTAVESCFELAQ